MVAKVLRFFHLRTGLIAAAFVAGTLGLTVAAVAQNSDQGPDPAAQNSAPADAPQAPPSKVTSDAQIEANVLSALAGAPSLADQPINTTTTYGTVTLSGTVKDDASKKLAAKLASTSPGVKKVIDSLEVGDISAASQTAEEGAAPLPNNAPAPDPNAQAAVAPQEQGYPQPEQQEAQQNNYPQPDQQAPPMRRNRNCPPAFTPDGRPYPPPPGCEAANQGYMQGQPDNQQYGPGQAGGQQVTIAPGAHLQIRVSQGMDGKHTPVGSSFNGILMNDVMAGGTIALPRGAEVSGTVVDAKVAGGLTGSGAIALQLTGISFGGQQYALESKVWGVNGPSKTGNTVGNTVGLGLLGAVIGGAVGGGGGAAVGAIAGGGAGLAASAATPGPQAYVPSESLLNFSLAKPVTVTTVSQQELNRLALAAPGPRPYPAGPVYYRRPHYRAYYGYPYGYYRY